MIKLTFLDNQADEDKGLGDAGIETFRDAPYASTARECGQNSADAKTQFPVTMKFDMIEIPATDIPDFPSLVSAIDSCLGKADASGDEKEQDFFKIASRTANSDSIKVLRIADFNTTGLLGPCKPGKPFHSLVKSAGVSNKGSDTSTGSFGIGKNAVYAISDLQTVFYSTVYADEENKVHFLAQGKTVLVSHTNPEGKPKDPTGYWGADQYRPLEDASSAPVWLRRDQPGTSIFAIGFRERKNWQYRMGVSLITNFFPAIHREQMQFSLDDGNLTIDRGTLHDCFENAEMAKAAEESGMTDEFQFSQALYQCLTSTEASEDIIDIPELGRASIQILVKDNMPKKVCIIRNGMVISDNLAKFGQRFISFPGSSEFIAMVEPIDDAVSALLKKLEDPKHRNFSAERLSDDEKRNAATKAMKFLGKEIRLAIRRETQAAPSDEDELDELSKFFADLETPEKRVSDDAENDPEKLIVLPPRKKAKKRTTTATSEDGGDAGGGGRSKGGSGGGGSGPDFGSGEGGKGTKKRRHHVPLEDSRNIILADEDHERRLFFTPTAGGPATISVMATGMVSPVKATVSSSDRGTVVKGNIQLDLVADQRMSLSISLTEDYNGPIEVIAIEGVPREQTNAN